MATSPQIAVPILCAASVANSGTTWLYVPNVRLICEFVPHGHERTTAELSPEEKNAISHRGRAFRVLAPAIDELAVRAEMR